MKIKLIYPRIHPTKRLRWKGLALPLNLCYLAGLTPKDISVKIVDTEIEPLNFNEPVDLVGLTATTATVTNAYAIADEFFADQVERGRPWRHSSVVEEIKEIGARCLFFVDDNIAGIRERAKDSP
ncbi:MAG: hypothetical protein ACE5GU_10005 [Candidatus Scalinduaceae bacterium]